MTSFKKKWNFLGGKTGSGKTHLVINNIIDIIKNEKSDEILVFALPNLCMVDYVYKKLDDQLAPRHLKFVFRYISNISKKNTLAYSIAQEKATIPKIILTTQAYLHKRGDSQLVYPFIVDLLWLKNITNKKLLLYCDECQVFFNSLIWSIKISGLIESRVDIGNVIKRYHVSRFESWKNEAGKYSTENTTYTYGWDFTTKNPQFSVLSENSIKNENNCFEPKTFIEQNLTNFKQYGKGPLKTGLGSNFDMIYTILKNENFSYDKVLNKPLISAPRGDEKHLRNFFLEQCKSTNVSIKTITDLDYVSDFQNLLDNTTHIVFAENKLTSFGVSEPGATHISGIRYDTISLIDCVFEKTVFISASLTKEMLDIFQHLDPYGVYEIQELNTENTFNLERKDFGAIFFARTVWSASRFTQIIDTLGNGVYFCGTSIRSAQIAKMCINDITMRTRYLKIERDVVHGTTQEIFHKEYMKKNLESETENLNQSKLILSYWNSSISSGVDLSWLDFLIVDYRTHLPFLFLPFRKSFDSKACLYYIIEKIHENLLQCLGRINRGSNESFTLNFVNLPAWDEKTQKDRDDLSISWFTEYESTKRKFKHFILYYDVEICDLTIIFAKHLKNTLKFCDAPKELTKKSIIPDLLNFVSTFKGTFTDRNNLLKAIKKYPVGPVKAELIERFENNTDLLSIFSGQNVFIFPLFQENEKKVTVGLGCSEDKNHFFDIKDKTTLLKFQDFCEELISRGFNLIYFSSARNNKTPAIIGYLLNTVVKTTFVDFLFDLEVLLKKEKPGTLKLKNKNIRLVNLKTQLNPDYYNWDLVDTATAWGYTDHPTTRGFNCDVEKGLSMLKYLFKKQYSNEKLSLYQDFLQELSSKSNKTFTINEAFDLFSKNDTKKWLEPILKSLGKKRFLPQSEFQELSEKMRNFFIAFIKTHKWLDFNIETRLLGFIESNCFYRYDIKTDKILFYDKEKTLLDLKFDIKNGLISLTNKGLKFKKRKMPTKTVYGFNYTIELTGLKAFLILHQKLLEQLDTSLYLQNMHRLFLLKYQKAYFNQTIENFSAVKFFIHSVVDLYENRTPEYTTPEELFLSFFIAQITILNLLDFMISNEIVVLEITPNKIVLNSQNKDKFTETVSQLKHHNKNFDLAACLSFEPHDF